MVDLYLRVGGLSGFRRLCPRGSRVWWILVLERSELPSESSRERELLEAIRAHGEVTPAQAAMNTTLTVSEADEMLKELAEGGHLDVRVRGGGLFYALWGYENREALKDS